MSDLRIQIIATSPECIPTYATPDSAGMDLKASESVELLPGERKQVPTGIRMAIPKGYEGQIRPRSGLAWKTGLSIPNAPGTIDSDYRGEIKVILINLGHEMVKIAKGDRIAQLVISPVVRAELEACDHLDDTERGVGGFGSTGVAG